MEFDAEDATAPTSSTMEMDLTPPKKRIKSAQASRSASTEPSTLDAILYGDVYEDAIGPQEASSLTAAADASADMVKTEIDHVASTLEVIPTTQLEPLAAETFSSTLLSVVQPESDAAVSQPIARKKKTSSASLSSKKDGSALISTSKSKKSSASTKKATCSTSSLTHPEPPSSRSRTRAEPVSPPPVAVNTVEEAEEEDTALYCICQRRQDDVQGGMIMCDRCEQWYHYRCMDITEDDAELVDQFICPPCHQVTGEETTYKAACSRAECRRAARSPFSKYCSERCGVLAVTARLAALKVEKNKAAVAKLEADERVMAARQTEGFTLRTDKFKTEWKNVVAEQLGGGAIWAAPIQRLRFGDAFAVMVKGQTDTDLQVANDVLDGAAKPAVEEVPVTASTASFQASKPTTSSRSPETSSATSLIGVREQLTFVANQILAVDLEKSRLNARLDRLDLRSTLLHLVSDRVPTLAPVGSSSAAGLEAADENDEEMPDLITKPKKKKKASSKSKSKSSTDLSGGPRCGYDQRLHWDDPAFDVWAHDAPGSAILAHETALDGVLYDTTDTTQQPKLICATPRRKCRRHADWSNLCELALDTEKASLNADSRVLTQRKLALVKMKERLTVELDAVKSLVVQEERANKRREEERDRNVAMRMANEGTRRGALLWDQR